MAQATITLKQRLTYAPQHAACFAANQALFNAVTAFYFEVIQAHDQLLTLKTKEALSALETLTHATSSHPHPVMPLAEVGEDIPAMFRRAAINAALGSAKSFFSHLKRWHNRKEKMEAKGKKFTDHPPVPPRTWSKSVPFYAGLWRTRTDNSMLLKVWTGTCWSWIKVRISGRSLPEGYEIGSPQLVRHGSVWWLHTPVEKAFQAPQKVEEQLKEQKHTRICSVDLNLGEHVAVCSVQNARSVRSSPPASLGEAMRYTALGRVRLDVLHAIAARPASSPRGSKITSLASRS
jgi:putative transposase